MGLAERRAAEKFKNDDFPGWQKRIEVAAGFDIPVEVNWEELAVPDYATSYGEFFPQVYFQPLVDALGAVTVDEMGQAALREGLEKIVIRNTGQYSSSSGIGYHAKVLTIDHKPNYNVSYGEERAQAIQRTLEDAL
jgi:hypothetical protein